MDIAHPGVISLDLQQLVNAHRSGAVQQSLPNANLPVPGAQSSEGSVSFEKLLQTKINGLKFSAHAESRIKSRNIDMSPEVMGKLENAVSGAARKGARDSLVLMKGKAFIVNIPNRTVITAMDGESIKDNVFTNIDSTVIAD